MAKTDKYQALIEALGHPIRRRVLRRYLESAARLSPKELADSEKLSLSLSLVGYHVRRLQKLGAVELVGHRQRRGACQHFYRPTSLVKKSTLIRVALSMKAG
jgi:DNA-binding transcriptional ArsR family regulator